MAEKTEKATPKKLKDARKKGQVAKSKDFPAAFTFMTSFALIVATAGYLFDNLAGFMISCFTGMKEGQNLAYRIPSYLANSLEIIFNTSIPFMILISLVGVIVNFLIIGPLFSMEAMKPDIKKLNPVTNIKGMFKLKTFIELLKSIFKIAGAMVIIYATVYNSLPDLIATAALPVLGSAVVFSDFLIKVSFRVGLFFLVIAIFDLVFQKKNFAKEMKMEKFEVKQEIKDTEGNPEIKGKRRQVAHEIAYQDGPQTASRARAIISNPIHIAVAISYEAEKDPAPKILVMGKGVMADNIVKVGQEHHVPVMRNVPLAQELYNKGKIGHYVPEETYEAIAEVLKWISALEKSPEYNVELFK
ncbi:MAG: type III secretion system export apparatus subunit SctU [Simkania negevensis]|nr:type III secretion system export apparatus subunit SctU [Simkania negevensis]